MHLYEPTTFLKVTFTSGVFLDMFQIFRTPNLTVHLTKSFKINNLVYFLIVLDLCFYPALVAVFWNMWYICKMFVSQKKNLYFATSLTILTNIKLLRHLIKSAWAHYFFHSLPLCSIMTKVFLCWRASGSLYPQLQCFIKLASYLNIP